MAERTWEGTLQQRYDATWFACFGCGPANEHGLQLHCWPDGEDVVATFRAQPHHQGPPGMVHGGLLGALLDCHGAWTACHDAARQQGTDAFVPMVTALYQVRLRRPTPLDVELQLRGRVTERNGRQVVVTSELRAADEVTVAFEGRYVQVPFQPEAAT